MQEHLWRFGEFHRLLNSEAERYEIGRKIEELVAENKGRYSETLKINTNGSISKNFRLNDESSPLLPVLLPDAETSSEAYLDDAYQLLKELGSILPSYNIDVTEDENRTSLTYTISAK